MKVKQEELVQLQKIERLYGEIDKIYSGFSPELQEKLHDMHNYEGSLGYCTRWGMTAASEIVEECEKDTRSVIDDFKDYCSKKAVEAANKYNKQYLDKCMVIDKMWDSSRDDCDMYDRTAEYLIDEYLECFEDCVTVEECERVMKEKKEENEELFLPDYLGDERMNLAYGAADLKGAVIIEVGSIGRWNGTLNELNILDVENIGELLESDCEQWMCYVDKETGEFCKSEYHHDGSNHYEYRELTCDRDEFEEMLEQAESGEMAEIVSKYSKSIGPRVAEVYGWDLEKASEIEKALRELRENGMSFKQVNEIREKIVLDGESLEEAKLSILLKKDSVKAVINSIDSSRFTKETSAGVTFDSFSEREDLKAFNGEVVCIDLWYDNKENPDVVCIYEQPRTENNIKEANDILKLINKKFDIPVEHSSGYFEEKKDSLDEKLKNATGRVSNSPAKGKEIEERNI